MGIKSVGHIITILKHANQWAPTSKAAGSVKCIGRDRNRPQSESRASSVSKESGRPEEEGRRGDRPLTLQEIRVRKHFWTVGYIDGPKGVVVLTHIEYFG